MKKLNQNYPDRHPTEYCHLVIILLCSFWHLPASLIGLIIMILFRVFQIHWKLPLCLGILIAGLTIFIDIICFRQSSNVVDFFVTGLKNNFSFLKILCHCGLKLACYYEYKKSFNYLMGMPLLIAGILQMISSFQLSPHTKTLRNLNRGILSSTNEKISDKVINKKLNQLKEKDYEGTLLGLGVKNITPLIIPDSHINQMVLVLGTTGAGKTITLRRFARRAIDKAYPLIIVDGKPTQENIDFIMKLADENNAQFFGFNCGNYFHYDVLSSGGYTELKDKIITLKDQWENDYYRTIAEDYLQTSLEVLLKGDSNYNLKTIAKCLDYKNLTTIARKLDSPILAERVESLQHYQREALTGLQAHLNTLIHSELGEYLEPNEKSFDLRTVINNGSIVYFALPALKYSAFAKVLGKLVVNDLKAIIDSIDNEKKIFTIFDEFSVFAGEQVLNLVNMGRGKGIHAIFGTQGLADLSKVSPDFESQLTNCVNTLICHRLNDQRSAEAVSHWIGTEDTFDITAQVGTQMQSIGAGSIRTNKAFTVHPDEIKRGLKTGEAFFISKLNHFRVEKVKVLV